MKEWIKKITGISKLEQDALAAIAMREAEEARIEELKREKKIAEEKAEESRKNAELATMNPRDIATAKGEPWISVLDIKVNADNIRNGFFELDWNSYFIKELVANGYGTEADPEEEIVDRWFRTIVYQMLEEEGMDTTRGAGYINVTAINNEKSEVS